MTADARALPHSFAFDRYSPLRFDPGHTLSGEEVDVLLEAARRAPSAGNSQPWAFIVGQRGDQVYERLARHLARSSSMWAPDASLLVANLAHRFVEDSDMEYSEFAHYDIGQAVAHMTFQAHTIGLFVHQFRAFDREAVASEFQIPAHWEVTTMAAIGVPVEGARHLSGAGTSHERLPLQDITWERADSPS
ncbi:nitroreductase family protein [Agromyces bauzanensis]